MPTLHHLIRLNVDMLDEALNGKPTMQKLYNSEKKELAVNA
jgi:hypothetical protein